MHIAWIRVTRNRDPKQQVSIRADHVIAVEQYNGQYAKFSQIVLSTGQNLSVTESAESIQESIANAYSQARLAHDAARADQLSQRFLAKHDPTRESRGSDIGSDVSGTARNPAECQRDLDPSGAVQ